MKMSLRKVSVLCLLLVPLALMAAVAVAAGPFPRATTVTVSNVAGNRNQTVNITATLRLTNGVGLGSLPVEMTVGSSPIGLRWTDRNGVATWSYRIPGYMAKGNHQIVATSRGNGLNSFSTGVGTLTVR